MPEEDVLAEVRRVREELAREYNYDLEVMFARHREMRPALEAAGWKFVDLSAQHVRETPAAYGQPPETPAQP